MLTPKKRLFNVLEKIPVDRPPCICPGGMMNMITTDLINFTSFEFKDVHHDGLKMSKLASAAYENGCFENYGVPFCMTIEAEDMGSKIDFGNNMYEPHVIEYAIDSVSKWKSINPMNFKKSRASAVVEAISILKNKNDSVPVIGNITGPISTATSLMEPSLFYKELKRKNKESHEFLDFITEQLIIFSKAQIKAGADIIAISDPSGTGEILGPNLFDEFAVKYLNRLVDAIHKEDCYVIVHICGQMRKVYNKIEKIRSDAISFDSIVNLKDARDNLKNHTLMGNVSTYTIEFGTPDKIAELTKKCIDNGSNIVAPACGLGMKSPIINVKSILNFVKGLENDV